MSTAAVEVLPTSAGEDRAVAVPVAGGYLVAVADGAGGTGNGGTAAQAFINELQMMALNDPARTDWFDRLCELDDEIARNRRRGETTAVVAWVANGHVRGASVGDSSAWLISPTGEVTDLTAHQRRRPMLGSGEALPVIFEAEIGNCRLVLGTDGLFKYA